MFDARSSAALVTALVPASWRLSLATVTGTVVIVALLLRVVGPLGR